MAATRPSSDGHASHDAATVALGRVDADGMIELRSSALLEDLGPASPSSEERAATLVGQLVSGRYRVDRILGQGAMGAVYAGEQIHLRKRVAIKVLHPDTERLPGLMERFEREAVAGAHVQHRNVAAAIDFGKLDEEAYFLVLEYIEGTTLSRVLDTTGRMSPGRALRIARQMADGLGAVHDKGILHRDVKPQNTLLGAGDQVKIIDFGFAKVDIDGATGSRSKRPAAMLTAAGVVFGTPMYMAPEMAFGMGAIDARSDLYAMGVTLYEMLTGTSPFDGKDPASIFLKQRTEEAPAFRVRAASLAVPEAAERVTLRLIRRNPTERYQNAREVIAAIDEALAEIERAKPKSNARAGMRAFILAAVGLVALSAVAYGVSRSRDGAASGRPAGVVTASATSHASPDATVAPTSGPTGDAKRAEPSDTDASAWRGRLDKATHIRDWVTAAKSFVALARLDPGLLEDADMRAKVVGVCAGIAHEGRSDLADEVFDALALRLGTSGLDLLYELASSRGGTRGGLRAKELLARADVVAREPPALRIAFDLFVTPCAERHGLLARAASEGDRRTLVQLEAAHSARCANRVDPCCLREDKAVADAIAAIKARVRD